MRKLSINNPSFNETLKTYVSTDYASGTALEAVNTVSFAADDILVVGEPTEEKTEQKDITAVADKDTFTLSSGLNFAHAKGTPIYKTPWDQISIEGRSSSAGVFAQLVLTDIQWDSKTNKTIYFHSAGTDTWEYRFRFYNTQTTTYSEYSPTLTGLGFGRKMVGYMIRNVRKITNVYDQEVVSDDEIIRAFNRAQDIIYAHNPKYWFLLIDSYKAGSGIPAVASTNVYSLASYTSYGHLESVRYRYNNGSTDKLYHLTKKNSVEFDAFAEDLNQSKDDWAELYKLLPADSDSDNGYLQIHPKTANSSIGTIYPNYYEKMADLSAVADKTQVPLPEILEDFGISYVYKVKGDEVKAAVYEGGLVSENENKIPKHLLLLDKMDRAQKSAQGQPRSLSNFRGQHAMRRFYRGGQMEDRNWVAENYINDL